MEGKIVNYRLSKHTQKNNYMVILPDKCDKKEKAEKLVGKTVTWASPKGTEIKGKITAAHGGKGAVRVLFERGMPGQSLGTKVKISD